MRANNATAAIVDPNFAVYFVAGALLRAAIVRTPAVPESAERSGQLVVRGRKMSRVRTTIAKRPATPPRAGKSARFCYGRW